ncbi:InlB B-repeat-containing protein [Lactococcus allomyrinae]|uniref:InlB B-repeat-containing protein n=1 Tax=Lactococcus allomyrinae TaxID=2419773 RepID=UPI0013C4E056|nr:InlB B-repeat-containing protein [Lactococcus allomyrinae]
MTVTQPAVTFTINFDSNSGDFIPSQTVDLFGTSTEPKTPKKSGYTFDGWYTDKSLIYQFDFTLSIMSDYTLYAKWIPTSSTTTTGNASASTTVSSNTGDASTSTMVSSNKNMSNSRLTANVTLTDLSKNNKANTNVNSEKGGELPTTGESSSVFLYMVGLFSLLGATWLLFHRKIKN